jgi:hypothetical protein
MADAVLVHSGQMRSLDNLSVVVILFQPFVRKMGLQIGTPVAKSIKVVHPIEPNKVPSQ